jgi:hypothetical protein
MATKDENIEKAKRMIAETYAKRNRGGDDSAELNAGTPPEKETPEEPATALVQAEGGGVVEPLAKLEDMKRSWARFQAVKAAVVEAGDVQEVTRNGKKEGYIVKSGWRKIAVVYGLRTELLEKQRLTQGQTIIWNVRTRATAPNGAYAEAWGSCNSAERAFAHGESDMLMTAQTRATNRAISDVVGGGDVSAEEMN